jgi:preprotein translocase subunit SecF
MKLLKLVPDDTNIDFMKVRNIALILSVVVTIASLVLVGVRGLNLGVDFVGGQMVRTTFAKPIDVEQLRGRVGGLGLGEASIQEFGGPTTYQIRLPKPEGGEAAASAAATRVRTMLAQQYPGSRVDSVETVSGKVSEELASDGLLAIILAMVGIALFIWFRFEWQFGVGALATLFHDVAMILGFFALTQLQVDLNIVAAFLAVVGYSLNDTVVIYDRIRENLRKYRKMAMIPLLNLSLNETLSRTIVTSGSIMLALAVLLVFGPDVIFGLTLAILLGTFIGTYSSIYISAPILVWLGVKPDSFVRTDEDAPAPAAVRSDGAVV